MRLICPHCGSRASTRTSTRMSPLCGIATYQYSNVDCGHTFKAGFEIIATITRVPCPIRPLCCPWSRAG
ncbi:ogr/Delta-like zinc finger family protein [Aeromonas salmonicida]|uniref:ogr/Delta-like zinc finger family protein n=1 Tax=Aeromonas salmonicida TaxID=645 RepID=UPI0031FDCF48